MLLCFSGLAANGLLVLRVLLFRSRFGLAFFRRGSLAGRVCIAGRFRFTASKETEHFLSELPEHGLKK